MVLLPSVLAKEMVDGTRSINYSNDHFSKTSLIYESTRPSYFKIGLGYTGGRNDQDKVLALKFTKNGKDIGLLSHGKTEKISAIPSIKLPTGTRVLKHNNRKAQFEYPDANVIITSDKLGIWKTTKRVKSGEIKELEIWPYANSVFEQNGFRIRCANPKKICMNFRVRESPAGIQTSYLNVFSKAYIYKLKNGREDKSTGRLISSVNGLVVHKSSKRGDLILTGVPTTTKAQYGKLGNVSFKKLGRGFVRYEEKFKAQSLKVLGANIAVIEYPDQTLFEVMKSGTGKKRFIQIYSKQRAVLQLEKGDLTIYKKLGNYVSAQLSNKNVAFISDSQIKISLPGKIKNPVIKVIGHESDYLSLKIDKIRSPAKLYAGIYGKSGKLTFSVYGVKVRGSQYPWHEYKVSFDISIWKDGKYWRQECDAKTYICKVNGEKTYNGIKIQKCGMTSWCGKGQICRGGLCVYDGKGCKPYSIQGSPDTKLDIIVLGDGYNDEAELRKRIQKLILDGSFQIKPFSKFKDIFNIHYFLLKKGQVLQQIKAKFASTNSPRDVYAYLAKTQDCNVADHSIIISMDKFVSYAIGNELVALSDKPAKFKTYSTKAYLPLTMTHELGHSIGYLDDEYLVLKSSNLNFYTGVNCVTSKEEALRKFKTAQFKGCGGTCDEKCKNYFRPSNNSIMNYYYYSNPEARKFNEYSKNELIKKLSRYS